MKNILNARALLIALLIALALPAPVAAQGGGCLTDGEVQQAVASGSILQLSQVLRSSGVRPADLLHPVRVCATGSGLFYQLRVLEANGRTRDLLVNAKTGQPG